MGQKESVKASKEILKKLLSKLSGLEKLIETFTAEEQIRFFQRIGYLDKDQKVVDKSLIK